MFVDRVNKSVIYQSLKTGFVTAILGSRRVGKSTLIKHYAEMQSDQKWLFLNVDHFDIKDQIEHGKLRALIEEAARAQIGHHKLHVVIDEAQKCPALFDQVKALYDEFKDTDKLKFVLTGSGFLSLHELSAESLAGRIELYYLRDFSLQEVTKFLHSDFVLSPSLLDVIANKGSHADMTSIIHAIAPFRQSLEMSLSIQLIWGGLPEVVQQATEEQKII
jgi:predicted AAA+ superfamily ATPase